MNDKEPSETGLRDANAEPPFAARVARTGAISGRGDLIDVGDLFAAVRQRKGFVLVVGMVVAVGVMTVTSLLGMSFKSSAQLYLGEVETKNKVDRSDGAAFDFASSDGAQVASEIEMLQSPSLVRQAVLASGLNVTIQLPGEGTVPLWNTISYWKWRRSGRNSELLDTAMRFVRAVDTSLPNTAMEAQKFRVQLVTPSEYELATASGRVVGRGKLGERLDTAELSLTLVPGITPPATNASFQLIVEPTDLAVSSALKRLKITAPKESPAGDLVNILTLDFNDSSPRLCADFLRQLMNAYLSERQSWKTADATAAEAFVADQLTGIRDLLAHLQLKVAEYRRNNKVLVLDDAARAMVEQIGKYEEQRAAARMEVASLASVKAALLQPKPAKGAFLLGQANDPVFASMAEALSQARDKLTALEARFNDVAPDVEQQRAQVEAQLDGIRNYVSSRLTRSQENLRALDGIINQFDDKLKTVPAAELGMAQLGHESEVYSKIYGFLLERQQQAAISKASRLSKNRVLYAPEVPNREDSPNLVLRGAFLGLGPALGALLVVVQALFSPRFRSRADVVRSVSWLPLMTTIPSRPTFARSNRTSRRVGLDQALLAVRGTEKEGEFCEALRMARANLDAWSGNNRAGETGRLLVVTSPGEGDGKTTCASALAAILAADDKRVVFIDANLRAATGENDGAGLSNVLQGHCGWRDAATPFASASSSFMYIPSGGPYRPEVLTAPRMAILCQELRQSFDFIVVDCASFPRHADAIPLSRIADGTLTVLRVQRTRRDETNEHLRQLASHVRRHGLIINDSSAKSGDGGSRRQRPDMAPEEHALSHPSMSSPSPFSTTPIHVARDGPVAPLPTARLRG